MRRRDFLQQVAVVSPLGILAAVTMPHGAEAASLPKKGTGVKGNLVRADTNPLNGRQVLLQVRYYNSHHTLATLRLTPQCTYKIDGIKVDYINAIRNPVAANPQSFNDTYAEVYDIEFWGGATPKYLYFEPAP